MRVVLLKPVKPTLKQRLRMAVVWGRLFSTLGIGLSVSAAAQTFQQLHVCARYGGDGFVPDGALIQARDGNFYGVMESGGPWGYGTVFKMTPAGAFTTLATFNGTNGAFPIGALVQASDGNFYGATTDGGLGRLGTIFRVTLAGDLSPVWYFSGPDGQRPLGDLVEGPDAKLYGVTSQGGPDFWDPYWGVGYGTIFRIATNSYLETLFSFTWAGRPTNGLYPSGGLLLATDGNFYGVTGGGGPGGYGTVYRLMPGGSVTTLASFAQDSLAKGPVGRLLQANDGDFYGAAGGGSFPSAIFRAALAGGVTTFALFGNAADSGGDPVGGLIQASDGDLYGSTSDGGWNSDYFHSYHGTLFRLTLDGTLKTLVSFSGNDGPYPGATPYAGLTLGSDGNLYGTTAYGGSTNGSGSIFRIMMPGPELSSHQIGEEIVLCWRTNYAGFRLKSAPDLAAADWTDCTNPPTISDTRYYVTNTITGGSQFFRLKK